MKMRTISLLGLLILFVSGVARADGIDEAIPSFYQEPGISKNRDYAAQSANETIDPFTGKLQWHYVDVLVPGNGGLDIKVQRSYSSLNEQLNDYSAVGIGWTMHFGRVLRKAIVSICALGQGPTQNPVLELGDGSRHILYDSLDASYAVSLGLWRADCALSSPGGLIIHSPDGTRYEMTTPGPNIGSPVHPQQTWYTTRIVDINGNSLDFTYVALEGSTIFAPQTISASDGRSVAFTYAGSRLETIAGPSGTWTYDHTPLANYIPTQHFLTSVTRPDGRAWAYEYNMTAQGPGTAPAGGYSMKKAVYPTGGQVNYTYNFVTFAMNPNVPVSTVVTQKSSSEGTWNYTYTPATEPLDFSGGSATWTIDESTPTPKLDRTRVEGPEGHTTYFHVGYNSVSSGSVYLIGVLGGKVIATTLEGQTFVSSNEGYSWTGFHISNQTNLRPGGTLAFDSWTSAPLMTRKALSRGTGAHTATYSSFDDYMNPGLITEQGSDTRTRTVTYHVDVPKWILRQKKDETVSGVGAITRGFDTTGNLTFENRYGVNTGFTYDGDGNIATKTDANGRTVTYGSYSRGIPQTENHPEGVNISRVVSNAGNVMSESDGEGATTSFGYDGMNRITSITHPAGSPVTVEWGQNDRVLTRGNYQEKVTFDAFGRETKVQHTDTSAGTVVTINYRNDALGRRTFTSYPNSAVGTQNLQDLVGNVLLVRHEYNPDTGAHNSGRSYGYMADGTVIISNERQQQYTYVHRYFNDPAEKHLLAIQAPLPSASITMERNGLGQLLSAAQDGKTRTYTYTSKYFLETMTDPEVGTTTFGRDNIGNMISRTIGASPSTTYGYDGRDRLTSVTYPVGTPSVTRTYYRDDRPHTVGNGFTVRTYTYDGNKNLRTESLAVTGQPTAQIAYDYNANDALHRITYGSGKTVTYQPDGFGRPTQAAPYVTAVTHHPNGQIASLSYANGVTTTIGLDSRQRPHTLAIGGGTPLFNSTYNYDQAGNVLSINDTLDPTYNRVMDYDPLDRLILADGSWNGGTSSQIGYDGRGNITTHRLGTDQLTYTYDAANNRLQSIAGWKNYAFQYDTYGNVTHNGAKAFAYNDALNMRCADCGVPNEITYEYDGSNMRVRSTKSGVSTYFVYGHGGNLMWENTPGSMLKEYIYLGGKQVAVREKTGS